jgi:hypothetical protein
MQLTGCSRVTAVSGCEENGKTVSRHYNLYILYNINERLGLTIQDSSSIVHRLTGNRLKSLCLWQEVNKHI